MASARISRSHRRGLVLFLVCAFWALLGALLAWPVRLAPLELAGLPLQDAIVRHGVKTAAPQDFVFLAVDEATLDLSQLEPDEIAASPPLTAMAAGFPWSRAVYADIVEKVLGAGAKVVVLDVHFPLQGEGDQVLQAALQKHRGRVVIASLFDDADGPAGQVSSQFQPPVDGVLPPGLPHGAVSGFANFWPDADQVVREAHYRVSEADVLGIARHEQPQARGRKSGHVGEKLDSLATVALRKAGTKSLHPDAGLMRFSEPGAFPVIPLWSIFVPDLWKANLDNGAVFRDKIVMLGPLAARFRDFFRTPIGTLPGPEIHLHAMGAARADAFYQRAAPWFVALTCLGAGLLAYTTSMLVRRPLVALGLLALSLVASAASALFVYNTFDFLPGILLPALTLIAAGLTSFGYDFSLERREKLRVRRSLERYVSRDVVKELLDNRSEVLGQLGGVRKDVAVLFSDLRGFTALSERAEPEAIVAQLNEYLAGMVGIVFRHQGTLDKFIGDAVMAVWGTVTSDGPRGDCLRAVRAALAMLEMVETMRRRWKNEDRAELELGIGLNFGPAIFGNIGSEQKMEPTVIGDAVNLAARLEGVTKHYGVPIVLSGSVAEHVRGEIPLRRLDIVRVKGRGAPVEIFTVPLDSEARPIAPAWLPRHEEGWGLYRARRFREAAACFAECAAAGLDDASLRQMTARCAELMEHPPADGWEPVTRLESK